MDNIRGVLSQTPLCSSGGSNPQWAWAGEPNPGSRDSRGFTIGATQGDLKACCRIALQARAGMVEGERSGGWFTTALVVFHSASVPACPRSLSAFPVWSVASLLSGRALL